MMNKAALRVKTADGKWATIPALIAGGGEPGTGGVDFVTDETLTLKDGVLSVNTADEVEADNTLPVTSAAVHSTVGNIEILLSLI